MPTYHETISGLKKLFLPGIIKKFDPEVFDALGDFPIEEYAEIWFEHIVALGNNHLDYDKATDEYFPNRHPFLYNLGNDEYQEKQMLRNMVGVNEKYPNHVKAFLLLHEIVPKERPFEDILVDMKKILDKDVE
jgi:hypothetical protein